ncbi:MAG: DNA-binding protein WhiA [Clostridia bacterium]|nr:DNA-binding protein WhiA [Clostridia bacterium]
MSFSSKIKEEILKTDCRNKNCSLAFVAGISAFSLSVEEECVKFSVDSEDMGKKVSFICKKLFSIDDGKIIKSTTGNAGRSFALCYEGSSADTILKGLSLKNSLKEGYVENDISAFLTSDEQRFFIMGAYLGGGFMIDPEKTYHLEFVSKRERALDELSSMLDSFGEIPKRVRRDKYIVMYLKNYDSIENVLNIINAHKSMMHLTNIKIEKEQKNELNRINNFEIANIGKTAEAANKIIEDIESIMYTVGLDSLPDNLQEIALLRLANPEESLAKLASLSGLSRSGVNHRLKKISEIARELE